jgi:hypothetical protein
MIRYTYNRQVELPAPFIHVSLRCVETGKSIDNLPALIDTAAERTVIPEGLVRLLALVPLEELVSAARFSQLPHTRSSLPFTRCCHKRLF